MSFDWDTNEISILLLAKLARPFMGTARIIVNSLHIKGDVWTLSFFSSILLKFKFALCNGACEKLLVSSFLI